MSDFQRALRHKHVTLKSFLGTTTPPDGTEENENYWHLIGISGKVIDDVGWNDSVLILFDVNLDDYKLENHNPIRNSLWIKISDLKIDDR